MSVSITFQGDTWAEVTTQMADALAISQTFNVAVRVAEPITHDDSVQAATDEPEKAKPARKPKADPVAEAPKAETPKAPVSEPKEGGLDYLKDVKPFVLQIAANFGRDKVMEVLAPFGVVNAAHVPAEDLPALMEAIHEALGA